MLITVSDIKLSIKVGTCIGHTSILTNDRPVEPYYEEKSFRLVSKGACVWL